MFKKLNKYYTGNINPIGMTSGGSVVGGFIKVYWRDVVRTFFNAVYCYYNH